MRKVLISTGYGAGWSSWNSGEVAKYMLEYQPIIEFLEAGGSFNYEGNHDLLEQLKAECKQKFDEDYVCVLGADGLVVVEVDGPVHVTEYDGYEGYQTPDNIDWM